MKSDTAKYGFCKLLLHAYNETLFPISDKGRDFSNKYSELWFNALIIACCGSLLKN